MGSHRTELLASDSASDPSRSRTELPGALPTPKYGAGALCDVLPSAAAALGCGEFPNIVGIPAAQRICVLVIDGLGAHNLVATRAQAPFLSGLLTSNSAALAANAPTGAGGSAWVSTAVRSIASGFPTTTSASLASLGIGLPPGQHGLVGHTVRVPETGKAMNLLRWDGPVTPERWQPLPTLFEQLASSHPELAGFHVGPAEFRSSGLTRSGFRGATYLGYRTAGELITKVAAALGGPIVGGAATDSRTSRRLVFAYYPDLDKTGHLQGWASTAWGHELALVDLMIARLAAELDDETILIVTGDHGMVDIPPQGRIDLDSEASLQDGVALIAGEARARHVYAPPTSVAEVYRRWRERLGNSAWVLQRDEAIERGLFGPVRSDVVERIGDVLTLAGPGIALTQSKRDPHGSSLIGMHGSLTTDELDVPFLITRGGSADGA